MKPKTPSKKTVSTTELALSKNTTVSRRKDKEDTVIKKGTPIDHATKHNVPKTNATMVGASFGVTLNMDNYESARIDCWLTDVVRDNEDTDEAFHRVLSKVQEHVSEIAYKCKQGELD